MEPGTRESPGAQGKRVGEGAIKAAGALEASRWHNRSCPDTVRLAGPEAILYLNSGL